MHNYIRFVLSLILIISNLSVAFSMHLCEGRIERVKLNHLDNESCKMQKPVSCCAVKAETKHCEIPEEKEDKDCCKDVAYQEDLQNQLGVDVLKITPVDLAILHSIFKIEIPEFQHTNNFNAPLDFYVQSNAPPIYILHQQLVLYEA